MTGKHTQHYVENVHSLFDVDGTLLDSTEVKIDRSMSERIAVKGCANNCWLRGSVTAQNYVEVRCFPDDFLTEQEAIAQEARCIAAHKAAFEAYMAGQ